jgi:hypothetical protein
MRAGSAGMSNISGAWAAIPSVRPICLSDGIEKAGGRMGARRAWRWRSVEEEMTRRADGIGEGWDFGYQRCMGCGSLCRADVCAKWNWEGQGADGRETAW